MSRPQQATRRAQIAAVFAVCIVGLALVLVGETAVLPGVTLGSYALLAVLVATWTLPTRWANAVVAAAIAVVSAAVALGSVDPVTGGFQFAAVMVVAVVGRLAVIALQRSEQRRSALHDLLLQTERQRLDETAARLAEKERLSTELGEALTARSEQADELRRLNGRLVDFTADAAHELRAPLAVMRAVADRALDRLRGADDYRESLTTLQRDVIRLSELADTLLLLATADDGILVLRKTPVDAADSGRHGSTMAGLAETHDITVELDLPDEGVIDADQLLLTRLFYNLQGNACRYTPTGGSIALAAHSDPGCWHVSVSNTGLGVPPELRDEMFERFKRGDPSRTRATGGAGLGLALCQTIARLHGGEVRVEQPAHQRTRFTVDLPDAAGLVTGA